MTLTHHTLADLAAITAAMPGSVLRLGTRDGGSLIVGEHPHGALCPQAFRHLVAAWDTSYEPAVDSVTFVGAAWDGGVVSRPRRRLFATRIGDLEVARCLRSRDDWPAQAHATVRRDPLLQRSIVSVLSDQLTEPELDEAVRLAQGACLVEELVVELQRG